MSIKETGRQNKYRNGTKLRKVKQQTVKTINNKNLTCFNLRREHFNTESNCLNNDSIVATTKASRIPTQWKQADQKEYFTVQNNQQKTNFYNNDSTYLNFQRWIKLFPILQPIIKKLSSNINYDFIFQSLKNKPSVKNRITEKFAFQKCKWTSVYIKKQDLFLSQMLSTTDPKIIYQNAVALFECIQDRQRYIQFQQKQNNFKIAKQLNLQLNNLMRHLDKIIQPVLNKAKELLLERKKKSNKSIKKSFLKKQSSTYIPPKYVRLSTVKRQKSFYFNQNLDIITLQKPIKKQPIIKQQFIKNMKQQCINTQISNQHQQIFCIPQNNILIEQDNIINIEIAKNTQKNRKLKSKFLSNDTEEKKQIESSIELIQVEEKQETQKQYSDQDQKYFEQIRKSFSQQSFSSRKIRRSRITKKPFIILHKQSIFKESHDKKNQKRRMGSFIKQLQLTEQRKEELQMNYRSKIQSNYKQQSIAQKLRWLRNNHQKIILPKSDKHFQILNKLKKNISQFGKKSFSMLQQKLKKQTIDLFQALKASVSKDQKQWCTLQNENLHREAKIIERQRMGGFRVLCQTQIIDFLQLKYRKVIQNFNIKEQCKNNQSLVQISLD